LHGHGKQSLKHFEQICDKGVQPNDTTFVWLLSCRFWWMKACAVTLHWSQFTQFLQNWNIKPALFTSFAMLTIHRKAENIDVGWLQG
jgi:hypothetical protein